MTAAEQLSFLERETARATAALSDDGKPIPVNASGLLLIKREVDDYAARVDTSNGRPGHEPLRVVLDRAAHYAPGVSKTFASERVPASLGIYVALVESEYQPCLESTMGAKGVFQFLPATAVRFGLAAEDLCDVEKSAVAAARYLHGLRDRFGASGKGALLAIVAYNQGERSVEASLANERDVWGALARTPNAEGTRYVARILAATIIGERPEAFGVPTHALTAN